MQGLGLFPREFGELCRGGIGSAHFVALSGLPIVCIHPISGFFDRACRSETDGFMSNFNEETVLSVHHWTDRLFSFKTTRNPSFRYRNGQFTMIGLKVEGKPLLRAYSM